MHGQSYYIGVDPGGSGAVAVLDITGQALETLKTSGSESDLMAMLRKYGDGGRARAVLEKVHASPQMGRSSAFTFGVSFGAVRMALVAAGIPFDEVSPQKWQTLMGCRAMGKRFNEKRNATEAKNITKRRAQQLFPGVSVTHAIADALLLADYCRRTSHGAADPPPPAPASEALF